MTSRSTPLEQLPEMQDGIHDLVDEYNTPQVPAPRPQHVQPAGAADAFHYDQVPAQQPIVQTFVQQEDWKTYIINEGKLPLLAAILYFIISLDFVDEHLLKYIPRLFNNTCELTMSGVLFKAIVLMGLPVLLLIKYCL